jgi:hypothetical protein
VRYHLTIRDRDGLPPCQSITVGKLDFRRYTAIPSTREGLPDQIHHGAVGEYTDEEVAGFREAVKHLVVRWGHRVQSDGSRRLWSAAIHDVRCSGFFAVPEADQPLAELLDVQPITITPVTMIGNATAEQIDALAVAQASEERARREDPQDQSRRARHARAKATGEGVEG